MATHNIGLMLDTRVANSLKYVELIINWEDINNEKYNIIMNKNKMSKTVSVTRCCAYSQTYPFAELGMTMITLGWCITCGR